MAHVWNITTGNIYVSKNGNDVTGSGSKELPYASINKATTVGATGNIIVIGTGVWAEARGTSANIYTFVGDGEVVFDLSQRNNYFKSGETIKGVSVINNRTYDIVTASGTINIVECDIEYLRVNAGRINAVKTLIRALVAGHPDIRVQYSTILDLRGCTVLSGERYPTTAVGALNWSYVFNSIVQNVDSAVSQIIGNISYCCLFNVPSTLLLANSGSIVLNPKFNADNDFTLSLQSPCLFAGKYNASIGAFGLGYRYDANSAEFSAVLGAVYSATASVQDIIKTSMSVNGVVRYLFLLNPGHLSGSVESAWIDFQAIRYLLITRLFANIIYNASGVALSRADNISSAGDKAVYYDFELKWCNTEAEKAASVWRNVIWNKAVTTDNSGRGNADPLYVPAESKYISARYIKIKIYLTEL